MPERAHEWDAGADLRTPHDIFIAGEGYTVVNTGIHVETGIFGADMKVSLINDGPCTFMLQK